MLEVVISNDIIKQLFDLDKKFVTIGIHGEEGEQKKVVRTISAKANLKDVRETLESAGVTIVGRLNRHRTDKNLTVAQVAEWMEFGTRTKKGNVGSPERSFLRSTLREQKNNIKKLILKNIKEPEKIYDIIGTFVLNAMKRKMIAGIAPANAQSTIDRKGSSKTLKDMGQLITSPTYKVQDK